MISPKGLAELKKKYPHLFLISLGHGIIVRPLTKAEYEISINSFKNDESAVEEFICMETILYPELKSIDDIPFGWVNLIASKVKELSGFEDPLKATQLFLQRRAEQENSFERQAETIIRSAFSNITFEEMRHWDLFTLSDHLARAEWSLKEILGLEISIDIKEERDILDKVKQEKESRPQKLTEQGLDPMLILPLPEDPSYVPEPFLSECQETITESNWNQHYADATKPIRNDENLLESKGMNG